MKTSLGTDHFVHLRIIKYLKASNKYLLKNVFTINEKYCFYPFLLHWLISKLPNKAIQGEGYKKITFGINALRIIFFNLFCFQFSLFSNSSSWILTNIIYLTFPFTYLKWNAINTGLSARGFGLLLGEVYLYLMFGYFVYDNHLVFAIICLYGILFYLSSQFATQFFILASLFFTIFFFDLRFILIPLTSSILFYLIFRKVAKSFFYGQFNHKRNYLKYFLKTQFKHRKSFYRDFIYDFWVKLFRNLKDGIKYIVTNPFVETFYGFLYLTVLFLLKPDGFINPSNMELIILSGVFCFILTTFNITRFLGESQRYIQFTIPFIAIEFVNSFSFDFVLQILLTSIIIIVTYSFFYFRNSDLDRKNPVEWVHEVKNTLQENDVIISNDIQLLKIFSSDFQIISTDWTHYFKDKKEFHFNHPKNYSILSPEALNHFNKKYNPTILLLSDKLYNNNERNLINNYFSLKKINEFEDFKIYRINKPVFEKL